MRQTHNLSFALTVSEPQRAIYLAFPVAFNLLTVKCEKSGSDSREQYSVNRTMNGNYLLMTYTILLLPTKTEPENRQRRKAREKHSCEKQAIKKWNKQHASRHEIFKMNMIFFVPIFVNLNWQNGCN